jgi:hypothetical protein
MSNELMVRNPDEINKGIPSAHEMQVFQVLATHASNSKLYRNYGDESGIMITILAARELGISPMLALNGGLQLINGKMEISARLMNALMRKNGISISIKQSTDTICTIVGVRTDSGDTITSTYTIEEAQKAGLIKAGGGWMKNPKDMLFARAISRLARQLAPDIIGGCYVEGEIRAIETDSRIVEEVSEIKENSTEEKELCQKLYLLFDPSEHELLEKFVNQVGAHFAWSISKTCQEFLKDEKELKEKFQKWKNKQK